MSCSSSKAVSVSISNCGIPIGGWQVEYGLFVNNSCIAKSQGVPSHNLIAHAKDEARKLGQNQFLLVSTIQNI